MNKNDAPFDPTGYPCYRYHGSMIYIDTKMTASEMKSRCPMFFSNAHRGERRTIYKGHIIVQHTQTFSDRIPRKMTTVYVFDVRRDDTFCIETECKGGLVAAKELINQKLANPEPEPLMLNYETVEMMVPVKVRAAIFRDAKGKATNIEADRFIHVGRPETRQQDQPGDTFTTEVWSRLPEAVLKVNL
jgi:hypothetical protein